MERLNYHHLFIFWILAKEGTFSKTAEKLRIAQSAVTSQIKGLEAQLDLSLIDRTNRRKPILTEEGRRVLEFANSIFESGLELLKWSKQSDSIDQSILRVGAIPGISRNFLFGFLEPLNQDINVKMEIIIEHQEKLLRLLREHSLDLILSSHNVTSEGKTSFYSHVLNSSPIVFVINANKKKRSSSLIDYLSTHPLYIPGKSFEARPELDAFLDKIGPIINIKAEVDDIALLRIFALKSNAIVAIPQLGVINELKNKELILIGKAEDINQRYYAITRQKRFPNKTIAQLIENYRSKS